MTLVKDATGKYVNVSEGNDSTPATSDNVTNSGVQSVAQDVQSSPETDSKTDDNKDGLDTSKLEQTLIEEVINEVKKQHTVAPELLRRRREGQFRAIDRLLRTGGMDNQQADKAMVEIRKILAE